LVKNLHSHFESIETPQETKAIHEVVLKIFFH